MGAIERIRGSWPARRFVVVSLVGCAIALASACESRATTGTTASSSHAAGTDFEAFQDAIRKDTASYGWAAGCMWDSPQDFNHALLATTSQFGMTASTFRQFSFHTISVGQAGGQQQATAVILYPRQAYVGAAPVLARVDDGDKHCLMAPLP